MRPFGTHDSASAEQRRIALVGSAVAGVETQFRNVAAAAKLVSLDVIDISIIPFRSDDWIERYLALLPESLRSTLRQIAATRQVFRLGRLDGVWTQVDLPMLPWVLSSASIRHVPYVYSTDSTPRLLREFGPHYKWWGGRSRVKHALRDQLHAAFVRRARIVNPWTKWAAGSLRDDYGVDAERICVQPPGVDTSKWAPRDQRRPGPPRLVFVGGDFVRKGGDLLLQVFRARFQDRAELDMVTRQQVPTSHRLRVHTGLGAHDPGLVALYRQADLFVLPTRADCFSMAGLEAMACGVPVVTCPVGGVGELFEPGRQGLFVPPDNGGELAAAIELLLNDEARRAAMGAEARQLVLRRYDATANTAGLLDLLNSR